MLKTIIILSLIYCLGFISHAISANIAERNRTRDESELEVDDMFDKFTD